MFDSWGNSWQLVKASWAVLKSDKELMWFPVISGITMLIISIVMLVPSIAVSFSLYMTNANETTAQIVGFVSLFIFYLVTYSVSIYFNVALVGAAMVRLDGGDPTLKDGFDVANSRIGKIIAFGAMSATVGVVLRMIQERGGFIGQIVAGFIGLAWNVATFLVIPILVVKDISAWDAIKDSTEMLKKTWGEQITGNFSIGGVFGIIYLLLIIVGVALIIAAGVLTESVALVVTLIGILVFAMIALGIIQGALNGIFQAALYRYAETGQAPDNFEINLIQGAFKEKKKKNGMF